MNMLSEWWKKAGTEDKIIQFLVVILTVSISLDRTVVVSIATGAVLLYIICDCIKQKSLAGFYSPRRNWLGIAVFLFCVLAASVLLGDMASVHIALKYVYWVLPFLLIVYFESRADITYAVVAGAALSVVISSGTVFYLYLHGLGTAAGRIGAFSSNANHYSVLLIGILPVLCCALPGLKLKENKPILVLCATVIAMGLFSLWKTGSRGAMGGFFIGALLVLFLFSYLHKNVKLFLKGFLFCVAVISVYLLAGIPGGTERLGDQVRLRQLQSCYAMWKDHIALGVGLSNWENQYSTSYLQAEVIKQEAARRYEARKAARKKAVEKKNAEKKTAVQKPKSKLTAKQKAAARRKAAKKEAARKAAYQNRAVKHEADLPVPHNVVAWFFSTTGSIGGMGYLFFVCYYLWRLYRKVHEEPENWVAFAGYWTFIAVNFHGLFDIGITNKGAARLVYLMLGLALSYSCCKQQEEKLPDIQNG